MTPEQISTVYDRKLTDTHLQRVKWIREFAINSTQVGLEESMNLTEEKIRNNNRTVNKESQSGIVDENNATLDRIKKLNKKLTAYEINMPVYDFDFDQDVLFNFKYNPSKQWKMTLPPRERQINDAITEAIQEQYIAYYGADANKLNPMIMNTEDDVACLRHGFFGVNAEFVEAMNMKTASKVVEKSGELTSAMKEHQLSQKQMSDLATMQFTDELPEMKVNEIQKMEGLKDLIRGLSWSNLNDGIRQAILMDTEFNTVVHKYTSERAASGNDKKKIFETSAEALKNGYEVFMTKELDDQVKGIQIETKFLLEGKYQAVSIVGMREMAVNQGRYAGIERCVDYVEKFGYKEESINQRVKKSEAQHNSIDRGQDILSHISSTKRSSIKL